MKEAKEIQSLIDEAVSSLESHKTTIKCLESLVTVANFGGSCEEVGQALLHLNGGDYEKAKAQIFSLQKVTTGIFVQWLMAIRLTHLENKGEIK